MKAEILVVDRSPDWFWIIRDVLKKQSVQLTFTETISEAAHWLRETKFDLVISGFKMPDGSGLDLLPLIEKNKTPFILCTSFSREMIPNFDYENSAFVWKGEVRNLSSEVSRLLPEKKL